MRIKVTSIPHCVRRELIACICIMVEYFSSWIVHGQGAFKMFFESPSMERPSPSYRKPVCSRCSKRLSKNFWKRQIETLCKLGGSPFNRPVFYPHPLWIPEISQSDNPWPHQLSISMVMYQSIKPNQDLGSHQPPSPCLGSTQAGGVHQICSPHLKPLSSCLNCTIF